MLKTALVNYRSHAFLADIEVDVKVVRGQIFWDRNGGQEFETPVVNGDPRSVVLHQCPYFIIESFYLIFFSI